MSSNQNLNKSLSKVSSEIFVDFGKEYVEDFYIEPTLLKMGHDSHGYCNSLIRHFISIVVFLDLIWEDFRLALGEVDEIFYDLDKFECTSMEYLMNY